ncbi:MAG: ribosome recycling factor [bacterium]|nr:ribosome recycling factor [bacterium]MDN5835100.1 ribosome recycling factor [bacterium]
MFDTDPYEQKMKDALEHFEFELSKIRTGRAHPNMLDSIKVVVYGTEMPLNQASNITAPEAQMLLVTPFDPSNIQVIAAAIRDNGNLGFNPSDDGRVVRVPVPSLTEERRRDLAKQASDSVEDVRIVSRNIRQDALKDAKRKKDDKDMSEDDFKRVEKEIEKMMDDQQSKVDEIFRAKEADIMTI